MKKISYALLCILAVSFLCQVAHANEVSSLIKSLGDENERARGVAEKKLVRIGEPAEEALVKAVKNRDPLIRRHAGYALAQMGNPKAIGSLLETMISGGDKGEVERAAKHLAEMGCVEAIPVLIDMVKSDNKEIQAQGAEGLMRIGGVAVEPVLRLLKNKEVTVRIAAVNVLGAMREKRGVQPILEMMREDRQTRIYAIIALGKIGDVKATSVLIEMLENQDPRTRKMAALALGNVGDERAVISLIGLFEDEEPDVCLHAASGLSQFGEKAFEPLVALLKDKSLNKRKYAVITLGKMRNEKAAEPLLSVIENKTENMDTRALAVTSLGSAGGKEVIDELILILKSGEPRLAENGAKELAKLGESTVGLLVSLLSSGDPVAVANAKRALRLIGRSSVPLLINIVDTGTPNARVAAIEVLSDIGDESALPQIITRLHDKKRPVRIAAIKAAGKLGDERAVQPLIKCIRTKDREVKLSVIASLSLIGDRAGDRAVEELLKVAERERGDVRREAVAALGRMGSRKSAVKLIEMFATKDIELKKSLIMALESIGDERAVEPLIETLSDADPDIRRLSILALGRIGTTEVIEPLVRCLSDPAKNVRLATVQVLSLRTKELEDQAIGSLMEILREPDRYQQKLIAHILSSMGEVTIDSLLTALEDERPDVRRYAARALGNIRNSRAVVSLIEALDDEDDNVRAAAASALGEIRDGEAVQPLIKHLMDEETQVRIATAWALGNIGDGHAAMALNVALNDEDPSVQEAAYQALAKMTGQSCPLVTSLTRFDSVSLIYTILLGLVLFFPFVGRRIPPIDRIFRRILSKCSLPFRAKWWIMLFLGMGALALFIYCYVCETGLGAPAFALQKPGFLPTLYLYSFRVLPFFVGGCILSGFIMRYLSGKRRLPRSLLGATILGAVTPLCSCASIPMARGMLATRIPVRAVIAFLVATPILSPFIVIMSYGIIGLKFTLVRIISAFVLAAVIGILIERVIGREEVDQDSDFINLCRGCAKADTGQDPAGSAFLIAWNQVGYLLKYMVLGIFLGALIEAYLPASLVAKHMSSNFLGLVAAVTVGLPLYLCSGQEVLLLKPLMDMGLPLGHAIAFAISANGICLTSVALLIGAIGRKTTLLLTALFWLGPLGLGYLINMLL